MRKEVDSSSPESEYRADKYRQLAEELQIFLSQLGFLDGPQGEPAFCPEFTHPESFSGALFFLQFVDFLRENYVSDEEILQTLQDEESLHSGIRYILRHCLNYRSSASELFGAGVAVQEGQLLAAPTSQPEPSNFEKTNIMAYGLRVIMTDPELRTWWLEKFMPYFPGDFAELTEEDLEKVVVEIERFLTPFLKSFPQNSAYEFFSDLCQAIEEPSEARTRFLEIYACPEFLTMQSAYGLHFLYLQKALGSKKAMELMIAREERTSEEHAHWGQKLENLRFLETLLPWTSLSLAEQEVLARQLFVTHRGLAEDMSLEGVYANIFDGSFRELARHGRNTYAPEFWSLRKNSYELSGEESVAREEESLRQESFYRRIEDPRHPLTEILVTLGVEIESNYTHQVDAAVPKFYELLHTYAVDAGHDNEFEYAARYVQRVETLIELYRRLINANILDPLWKTFYSLHLNQGVKQPTLLIETLAGLSLTGLLTTGRVKQQRTIGNENGISERIYPKSKAGKDYIEWKQGDFIWPEMFEVGSQIWSAILITQKAFEQLSFLVHAQGDDEDNQLFIQATGAYAFEVPESDRTPEPFLELLEKYAPQLGPTQYELAKRYLQYREEIRDLLRILTRSDIEPDERVRSFLQGDGEGMERTADYLYAVFPTLSSFVERDPAALLAQVEDFLDQGGFTLEDIDQDEVQNFVATLIQQLEKPSPLMPASSTAQKNPGKDQVRDFVFGLIATARSREIFADIRQMVQRTLFETEEHYSQTVFQLAQTVQGDDFDASLEELEQLFEKFPFVFTKEFRFYYQSDKELVLQRIFENALATLNIASEQKEFLAQSITVVEHQRQTHSQIR